MGKIVQLSPSNNDFSLVESELYVIGMPGITVTKDVTVTCLEPVVFEGVTFEINDCMLFSTANSIIFRNCTFLISQTGTHKHKLECGIKFTRGIFLLYNPIIRANIKKFHTFAICGLVADTVHVSVMNAVITVDYEEVQHLNVYYILNDNAQIMRLQAFSNSITFTDTGKSRIYDGHCCKAESDFPTCERRHCRKAHAPGYDCKLVHECCAKKCPRVGVQGTHIRLLRSHGNTMPSFMNTHCCCLNGAGAFSIAKGTTITYVNSLTVPIAEPENWLLGSCDNILLTGFMSNITGAHEIQECRYPTN